MAAAAAAVLVVTAISAMASASAAIVLPGLKPNQPNQRTKQPIVAAVMLWPGIALTLPSLPYLPMRGPRMMTPVRAAQPPIECTCVEPAKSKKFQLGRQPAAAPDPVADDRIDRDRHDEAEDDERVVLDALGDGAGDDRGGGSGEHELEEELGPQRHAGPVDRGVVALVGGAGGRAVVGTRRPSTGRCVPIAARCRCRT